MQQPDMTSDKPLATAMQLHERFITIDACAPILNDLDNARFWLDGMATCGFATMALPEHSLEATTVRIAQWYQQARKHEDTVLQVFDVDDIRKAKAQGKLGVVLAFQSTNALGHDWALVELYHRLGVRAMLLAYNQAEAGGDGCLEPRDAGLTRFGRQVIAEMNRVGMLVDLSHCGVRTALEAAETSTEPVAITHTGAKAVYDHPRTVPDEVLRAVAARGGVIGINAHPAFIDGTSSPPLASVVDHLQHVVELVGIEHVGLGLDFSQHPDANGMSLVRYEKLLREGLWTPQTLVSPPWYYPVPSPAKIPLLTAELLERGYAEADIGAILGGNFMRLLEAVWKPRRASIA